MTMPVFKRRELTPADGDLMHHACVACGKMATVDEATGTCRCCWRVVVLATWAIAVGVSKGSEGK